MSHIALPCGELTADLLEAYFSRALDATKCEEVREHIDSCRTCWSRWNRLRWDRAKSSAGYVELQRFLGSQFEEYVDASWGLANEWYRRNPRTAEDIADFYRQAEDYVYNLLIWEASGQRPRYVEQALPYLRKYNCRRILDFGCGIGNDGLKLLAAGYEVVFHDYRNLSTEFLAWRLKQRDYTAEIVYVGENARLPSYDTVWAMDVLEHLPQPEAALASYLNGCCTLLYATEYDGQSGGRQPFHFQHSDDDLGNFLRRMGFHKDTSSTMVQVWQR